MSKILATLATLTAALATLVPGAAARPRLERLTWADRGQSLVAPVGDARTIVAWQSPDAVVHTLTAEGAQHALVPPVGCDGGLRAAGAGAVLLACQPPGSDGTGDRYAIVRVATGAVQVLRGPASAAGGEVWTPTDMGAVWIAGRYVGYHVDLTGYERHDGSGFGQSGRPGARLAADLSLPSLWRPLCGSLRRRAEDAIDTTDGFGWGATDGTFAAVATDAGSTLRRCGRGRVLRLGRRATHPMLGGGLATWTEGARVLEVLQADGRRRRLVIPSAGTRTDRQVARAGRVIAVGDEHVDGWPLWRVRTTALPTT